MNLTSDTKRVMKPSPKPMVKRKEKVVELIEVDGKKVSKTSTGKRKFHNKSKNGCDNCKRRRVKCDEGKPVCQRCLNMKLECVYTPVQPRKKKDSTRVKYVTKHADDKEKIHNDDDSIKSADESSDYRDTNCDIHESRHSSCGNCDNLTSVKTETSVDSDSLNSKRHKFEETTSEGNDTLKHKSPVVGSLSKLGSPSRPISSLNNTKNGMDNLLLPPLTSDGSNGPSNQQQAPQLPHTQQQQTQQQTQQQSQNIQQQQQPNQNGHQQQQFLLLPQLMTLTNSEKYVAFDLPNSPSFQPAGMNITNSIGSIFSPVRFPPVAPGQHQTQPQSSHQQQPLAQPQQDPLQQQNHAQTNPSNVLQNHMATSNLSFQAESLAQLNKASMNLKAMGNFPTAGVGGVTYDFQELLGIKYHANTQAAKANTAEEALANMQEQQEIARKNGVRSSETRDRDSEGPSDMIQTPSLSNNPTILSMAPITPMVKSDLRNSSASPAAVTVGTGVDLDTSMTKSQGMNKSHTQESASTTDTSQAGIIAKLSQLSSQGNLNLVDLKLFHHYCTKVWPSITAAGISGLEVWSTDIPELAFEYPFLMHSLLAFSATHLSRTEPGLEQYVSSHRLDALRLLRQAVLQISEDNTDALVASALILIMDSLANASSSNSPNSNGMSPSAWIFHVKGAATILTAVWPLTEKSRFYNLISVDLSDLGDIINQESGTISELVCFDESIADLYPVEVDSPYLITLAYLDKLHREKNQTDFILRVFAFPALLDKTFLALLMTGDLGAMRIMRSYYKLLRGFTTEMKDKVWFLEGVSQVLPQDVDEYSGGGGMHMMLDFLGGGLPSMTTTNLSEFM